MDYTNFDGDDDTPMPGENRLSRRIIKESKVRRELSRRRESAVRAKRELEERVGRRRVSRVGVDSHGYGVGHVKSPTEESVDDAYGGVMPLPRDRSNRSSAQSTAPLLSSGGKHNSGELSPTSVYSSVSAYSQSDHRHPTNQPQQPQYNISMNKSNLNNVTLAF